MWPDCRDRQELPLGQVDNTRDKNRHHNRKVLSESTTEGAREFIQKGKRICERDWTVFRKPHFEEAFSQNSCGA